MKKLNIMKQTLLLALIMVSVLMAKAQPGTIDLTFNPGTGFNDSVNAVLVQPDGKIVAGGAFTSFNGTAVNRIARLNTDGSLDTSFHIGTGFDSVVNAIIIQPDGKLLIGGKFALYNGTTRNKLARLNANGGLDGTFNSGTALAYAVNALVQQPDGKVIAGGLAGAYRFDTNGSRDTAFATSGWVYSMALQPDGKVVLGGGVLFGTYTDINRVNRDGSIDHSFYAFADWWVYAVALQPDGKVLYARNSRLIRGYNTGAPDTTFNEGVSDSLGNAPAIRSIALQPDGKILLGGEFQQYNGVSERRIVRLYSNGQIDPTFTTGIAFDSAVNCMALQADGKIIVGGSFTSFDGTSRNRIARLNGNGLVVGVTGRYSICSGDSSQFVATASAHNGPVTYSWSPSTGLNCTTCSTVKASPPTTTHYTLVVSDNTETDTLLITLSVDTLIPSVAISASQTTACGGDPIVFTATPTIGGASPIYQWKRNGSNVGNGSSIYYESGLSNKDTVKVVMTSNATCLASNNPSSNSIVVTILADPGTITLTDTGNSCSGANLLELSIQNGAAAVTQIQWQLNGTAIDTAYYPNSTAAGGNGRGGGANQLSGPEGIALGRNGDLYIADEGNNRIQKWAPGATSGTTVVGGAGWGSGANQLSYPVDVALDDTGNLYIADYGNNRIQKWAPGATSGTTLINFSRPLYLFIDHNGDLYFTRDFVSDVRKVAHGTNTSVVVAGGNGNGSAANQMYSPQGIFVDDNGNIFIADRDNHRVQKWAPGATSGVTVAGGNGSGSAANQTFSPTSVWVDASGNLYVSEGNNDRVQKWAPGATSGVTVVGGNGRSDSTPNQLWYPADVVLDSAGNIYVSDEAHNRIQKYAPNGGIETTHSPNGLGSYGAVVVNYNGCTSTSNTLTLGNVTTSITAQICSGQTYAGHSATGLYVDTLTASGGCDSIRTLHLTVAAQIEDTISTTITQGQSYYNYTSAGTYVDTFTSNGGCDSIRTLFLTVLSNNDTVWPGDANSDGVANLYDVLSLGLAYADAGGLRPNANNSWTGQLAPHWANNFNTGVNHNHADCDGNGTVDANDTLPIVLNYGQAHQKAPQHRSLPGATPLYLQITNAPVVAGDTARFDIVLGDNAIPASNIYGIAFSIDYDPALVDANSLKEHFVDSWLGQVNGSLLTLARHDPAQNQLDMAITRIDHSSRSGSGAISQLSVITIDNISGKDSIFGKLVFNITGVVALDENGDTIPVDGKSDTLDVYRLTDGIRPTADQQPQISVYPNPTDGTVNIVSNSEISSVRVLNIQGADILVTKSINARQASIELGGLPRGVYLLETTCGNQRTMKRVVLIR